MGLNYGPASFKNPDLLFTDKGWKSFIESYDAQKTLGLLNSNPVITVKAGKAFHRTSNNISSGNDGLMSVTDNYKTNAEITYVDGMNDRKKYLAVELFVEKKREKDHISQKILIDTVNWAGP